MLPQKPARTPGVAIPLIEHEPETTSTHGPRVFIRPRGMKAVYLPKPNNLPPPQTTLIRKDRTGDGIQSEDKSLWFYLPEPYPWDAKLEGVHLAECFESDKAMIKTPRELDAEKALFLARFSYSVPDGDGISYLYFDENPPASFSLIHEFWASLAHSRATEIILQNPRSWATSMRVSIDKALTDKGSVVVELPKTDENGKQYKICRDLLIIQIIVTSTTLACTRLHSLALAYTPQSRYSLRHHCYTISS